MGLVTLIIDGAVAQEGQKEVGGIVTAVLILVHLFPSLAVTVRRLHNTDRTGWLVLLNCLPVLNLVLLVLLCLRGTPEAIASALTRTRSPRVANHLLPLLRPLAGHLGHPGAIGAPGPA